MQQGSADVSTIGNLPQSFRHSLDLKYYADNSSDAQSTVVPGQTGHIMASPPKPSLQQSFSTNDIPTVKSSSVANVNPNNHAHQYLQNHNASMGRIPAGAMVNRHSRELSNDGNTGYASISSTLQASATPFGPVTTQPPPPNASAATPTLPASQVHSAASAPYMGYYNGAGYNTSAYSSPQSNGPSPYTSNIPLLSQGMQGLSLGNSTYSNQNFTGYGAMYGSGAPRDSQARVIQSRRQMDNEGMLQPLASGI
jgi:hypothetical protein